MMRRQHLHLAQLMLHLERDLNHDNIINLSVCLDLEDL